MLDESTQLHLLWSNRWSLGLVGFGPNSQLPNQLPIQQLPASVDCTRIGFIYWVTKEPLWWLKLQLLGRWANWFVSTLEMCTPPNKDVYKVGCAFVCAFVDVCTLDRIGQIKMMHFVWTIGQSILSSCSCPSKLQVVENPLQITRLILPFRLQKYENLDIFAINTSILPGVASFWIPPPPAAAPWEPSLRERHWGTLQRLRSLSTGQLVAHLDPAVRRQHQVLHEDPPALRRGGEMRATVGFHCFKTISISNSPSTHVMYTILTFDV